MPHPLRRVARLVERTGPRRAAKDGQSAAWHAWLGLGVGVGLGFHLGLHHGLGVGSGLGLGLGLGLDVLASVPSMRVAAAASTTSEGTP